MADKNKKPLDNETYFGAILGVIIIIFVGFVMVVSDIQKLVPSEKYVNTIVGYADSGIRNLEELKYPLIIHSLQQAKDNLKKGEQEMKKIATFEKEYQKSHNGKGFNTIKLIFSSKKNEYKSNLKKFLKLYIDFIKYRAEIFFYYAMSRIIQLEYITLFFVLMFFLLPLMYYVYDRYIKKAIEDKRIFKLFVFIFLSAALDDKLKLIKKCPYSDKYLIDIDKIRYYVRNGLSGNFKDRKVVGLSEKILRAYKEDPDLWRYFYAIGSTAVFMKNALAEKNGKPKKDRFGQPASLTGHHNPDTKYGLLVHSISVAYYSMYLARLDGVEDVLELLKVFYAGFVHDAGKIRLYKKIIGGVEIIEAPDAVEGSEHIKKAMEKAKKNKERWISLLSNDADQETQKRIFLSKTCRVFDDQDEYKKKYVKPADHTCVDAELRYTAMEKKERIDFFKKAVKEFFKESEKNRKFNSFDFDMVGVVFEVRNKKAVFLLATFATRLRKFIEDRYGEKIKDLKLKLPLGSMALGSDKGQKLRPFSYSVAHFLYESDFLKTLHNPQADIIGLYDIDVKRKDGQRIEYNACWLIEDFDRFCKEFNLTPEISEGDLEIADIIQRVKNGVDEFDLKKAEKEYEENKENVSGENEETTDKETTNIDSDAQESCQEEEKEDDGYGGIVVDSGSRIDKEMMREIEEEMARASKEDEREENQEKEKKPIKLEDIKPAFRQDGVKAEEDKYRVKRYLDEEEYKKLREDTYNKYNGRCALCRKKIERRNANVLEKYEPRVEITEKDGQKVENKKMVLVGTELLCSFCLMLKTVDVNKTEKDENYKANVLSITKRIVSEEDENKIFKYFIESDKQRKKTQKEYDTLSLRWLAENGYIQKKRQM